MVRGVLTAVGEPAGPGVVEITRGVAGVAVLTVGTGDAAIDEGDWLPGASTVRENCSARDPMAPAAAAMTGTAPVTTARRLNGRLVSLPDPNRGARMGCIPRSVKYGILDRVPGHRASGGYRSKNSTMAFS